MTYAEVKAAACDGKVAFKTAALAHKVLKRRTRTGKLTKIDAYRCPHCGFWHHGRPNR